MELRGRRGRGREGRRGGDGEMGISLRGDEGRRYPGLIP